jgi:hypothetical protein
VRRSGLNRSASKILTAPSLGHVVNAPIGWVNLAARAEHALGGFDNHRLATENAGGHVSARASTRALHGREPPHEGGGFPELRSRGTRL